VTVEGIRKATEHFLKTIEEENIFKFNSEVWDQYSEHYNNWLYRINSFTKTLQKIVNKIDDGTLSDEESVNFMVQLQLWHLASTLELAKFFFMVLVNPDKVTFDPEKLMYGHVIKTICKAIGFDKKLQKITLDSFMVDFRNAIFHNKYNILRNGIVYKNYENKSMYLTNDQLNEKINEANEIFRTIKDFADKKTNELNKQADELEKKSRFEN